MNNKLLEEIKQFAEEIIEVINKMGLTGDDIEPITRILSVATGIKMIEQNNLMLEQYKQMVNPWFSIKDKLPELNVNVLVKKASDSKYRLLSYHYSFDGNLIWQNEEGRFDYIDENDKWMPIPECKE